MTEQTLRDLAAAGAPSVVAPPFLAQRVLTLRHQSLRRRRIAASLALTGLIAGGTLAARSGGDSRFYEVYSPSGGNAPTLGIGEHLVLDRTLTPAHEDLIELSFTNGTDHFTTVKRLIGLPGDVIACPADNDGYCRAWTRNGMALSEPWVGRDLSTAASPAPVGYTPPPGQFLDNGNRIEPLPAVTVTAGRIFVLGDNRDASLDSRSANPSLQSLSDIKGVGVQVIATDGRRRAIPGAPQHEVPGPGGTVDPAGPIPTARARNSAP